jgi:hypothetical protein
MGQRIESYVEKRYKFGEDRPIPAPGEMQVVFRDSDTPYMVDFICPCGCGHTCPTFIIAENEPKPPGRHMWHYRSIGGKVTLHPSIRWTGGCKAHFNITEGKVIMHEDSGK